MFPPSGTLYIFYGYRVDCSGKEKPRTVPAPGQLPNTSAVEISEYHCAAGHPHEVLLCKTAEQQGIVLEEELLECKGYSMAKSLLKVTKKPTHAREDKKLRRVFCGCE